jgi:hypothetical protein
MGAGGVKRGLSARWARGGAMLIAAAALCAEAVILLYGALKNVERVSFHSPVRGVFPAASAPLLSLRPMETRKTGQWAGSDLWTPAVHSLD